MPSMLTHRIMGDDTLRGINPDLKIMDAIDKNFELYSIGTSGPDIFFFYAVYPWSSPKKAYEVSKYGSWLHREKTLLLFRMVFNRCKISKDEKQISYVAGLVLHWVLDSICHPYIYYRTGVGLSSNLPHRFFESQIDRGIADLKQIDLLKFKTYNVANYKEDTWYTIWQIYSEILKDGWKIDLLPSEMKQTIKDFRNVERWLYDPKGTKISKMEKFEKIIHFNGQITSMMIPLKLDPAWNVMNENHQEWHHPTTNEIHHESFVELFNLAIELGQKILIVFDAYLEDRIDLDDLMTLITGNFHTGLNEPDNMTYFDLVPTRIPNNLY